MNKTLAIPVRALGLWAFWILLVGRLDVPAALFGLVVAVGLSLLNRGLDWTGPGLSIYRTVGWLRYLGRLLVDIVRANIEVAALVLNPHLPISPVMVSFSTRLDSDLCRMVLGNSITLTPGTLTVQADGDRFTVHALTRRYGESMKDRKLERGLLPLERGR